MNGPVTEAVREKETPVVGYMLPTGVSQTGEAGWVKGKEGGRHEHTLGGGTADTPNVSVRNT